MANPMLAPAGALVVWTLVMLIWMAATFGPAVGKVAPSLKLGARASELDGVIDDKIIWKTHNYEHLLEQPTTFMLRSSFSLGAATRGQMSSLHGSTSPCGSCIQSGRRP